MSEVVYSKLDPVQIQRRSFDENMDALRVAMLPTEMSMELDSQDGDSVLVHKDMLVVELGEDVIPTAKFSKMMILSEDPNVVVSVKAVIFDKEIDLWQQAVLEIKDLCVPAITASSNTQSKVYIILQS